MSKKDIIQKILYNERQFIDALDTLSKAINEPGFNEYVRDAVIKRFEYTYEAAWKLLKSVLIYQGVELRHPKEIFSEAFSSGWLTNPNDWEAMIEDRNLTSHTYKERTAEMVFESITSTYYQNLKALQLAVSEVIQKYVRSSEQG